MLDMKLENAVESMAHALVDRPDQKKGASGAAKGSKSRSWLPRVWLGGCLVLASLAGFLAMASPQQAAEESHTRIEEAVRPIASFRVGDAVLADAEHGDGDTALGSQVDPATWRHLVLLCRKTDGSKADVELLRPHVAEGTGSRFRRLRRDLRSGMRDRRPGPRSVHQRVPAPAADSTGLPHRHRHIPSSGHHCDGRSDRGHRQAHRHNTQPPFLERRPSGLRPSGLAEDRRTPAGRIRSSPNQEPRSPRQPGARLQHRSTLRPQLQSCRCSCAGPQLMPEIKIPLRQQNQAVPQQRFRALRIA